MKKKTCPRCKQSLPVAEFGPNAVAPDGLQYQCRQCGRDYRKRNSKKLTARASKYQADRRAERLAAKLENERRESERKSLLAELSSIAPA